MANKIKEVIVEPSKMHVGDNFRLKIKVQFTPSYALITQDENNIITEDENQIITQGDYYE